MDDVTTRHAIQIAVLVLIFLATIVEKALPVGGGTSPAAAKGGQAPGTTRGRIRKGAYWTIMALCLIVGIVNERYQAREDAAKAAVSDAADKAAKSRAIFEDGLKAQDIRRIEDGLSNLEHARAQLERYGDRVFAYLPLVKAYNDLALGHERWAYEKAPGGCQYWLDEGKLASCRSSRGTAIAPTLESASDHQGIVTCTDIVDDQQWSKAGESYGRLLQLLFDRSRKRGGGSVEVLEIAQAARNSGYFYLCDYVRRGVRSDKGGLDRASNAWILAEDVTRDEVPYRNKETRAKRAVLDVIKTQGLGEGPCSTPCPGRIERTK